MTSTLDGTLDEAARIICEIPAAVALFDLNFHYVAASPAWVEAFGLSPAEFTGQRHDECCAYGRAALAQVQRCALAGERVERCPIAGADARGQGARAAFAGRPCRDRDGAIVGAVVGLHRLSAEAGVHAQEGISDADNGLADRGRLTRHLCAALADGDPARRIALVLAVSLDNLRALKNLHGTAAADRAVKLVGERLLAGTRSQVAGDAAPPSRGCDLVAALSAGQFIVACAPPAPVLADAHAMANRLLRLVQGPIAAGDRTLRCNASIGFVVTTAGHRDADDVLRDLDVALQKAQAEGPGKTVAWEPALTRAATLRYTLAEELRQAFDNGEFILHYQPVLRLRDERMVGAEALLRWNHPREGLALSAAFVPVLEETGLILDVGSWAVREAVRQLESWRLLYARDIVDWLSVNLSPRQLSDPAPLLKTLRAVHDGAFPVHRLRLEATGTALTHDKRAAGLALEEIQALGVSFAIDDFGAGRLSAEPLAPGPIDMVKIDAGLISQIGTPHGERLIEALLDLARTRGAVTVAKGVETAAQRDFLLRAGCDLAQGYLFGEPMDGAQLGAYALTRSAHAAGVRRSHEAANPPGVRRTLLPGGISLLTSADWSRAG